MNARPDTPEEQLAEALDLLRQRTRRIAELEIEVREARETIRRFMSPRF